MRKSLSFCTTCRNRLWQIKETLPSNLEAVRDEHEIVLVDYGSTDGLAQWVWSSFKSYIENKKLVFFEVKNEVRWNVARAKNLSHRLASGCYLFNLDADNFVTSSDIEKIQKSADLNLHCWQFSQGDRDDGSFGRIGLPTALFAEIGGYDEAFLPMGCQDIDILNRLVALGEKRLQLDPPKVQAIQNSVEQKVAEVTIPGHGDSEPTSIFRAMDALNAEISELRLKLEGPKRVGGGFTYLGELNGTTIVVDGLGGIWNALKQPLLNQSG